MNRFEYLIFDLDGVLIDSTPCHRSAYQALWANLGVSGPQYDTIAGKKTVEVVKTVTQSLRPTEQEIKAWVRLKQETARREMAYNLKVFRGAETSVINLSKKGWRMSVATGASRESALQAIESMGLTECFEFIVTADDVEQGKPDPMVFEIVLKKAQASAEKTLIVEDSISGVEAGLVAGACVCTVHTGVSSSDDMFMGAFTDLDEALRELDVLK